MFQPSPRNLPENPFCLVIELSLAGFHRFEKAVCYFSLLIIHDLQVYTKCSSFNLLDYSNHTSRAFLFVLMSASDLPLVI